MDFDQVRKVSFHHHLPSYLDLGMSYDDIILDHFSSLFKYCTDEDHGAVFLARHEAPADDGSLNATNLADRVSDSVALDQCHHIELLFEEKIPGIDIIPFAYQGSPRIDNCDGFALISKSDKSKRLLMFNGFEAVFNKDGWWYEVVLHSNGYYNGYPQEAADIDTLLAHVQTGERFIESEHLGRISGMMFPHVRAGQKGVREEQLKHIIENAGSLPILVEDYNSTMAQIPFPFNARYGLTFSRNHYPELSCGYVPGVDNAFPADIRAYITLDTPASGTPWKIYSSIMQSAIEGRIHAVRQPCGIKPLWHKLMYSRKIPDELRDMVQYICPRRWNPLPARTISRAPKPF